jgi:uncharacterized protein YodC (DUF2158 family)
MTPTQISAGDTVRHKSGGQQMTVTSFAGAQAMCCWASEAGEQSGLYGLHELDLVAQADDFPLGKACDLSGDGTCEACQ